MKYSLLPLIENTQFYSTWTLHTGNSFETNLAQIKNGLGTNMNLFAFFPFVKECSY